MARTRSNQMVSLRHNLKGIYTIWLRDVLRFLRQPTRIVGSLGGPILYLFVLGGGLASSMGGAGAAAGASAAGFDFRQFMFPGILGMTVLFTAMFSAVSIVWDREFGFLKEVMVAPISRVAVALGKVAGGSTVALFQGTIILLLAPLIGVKLTLGQIATLIGLMLALAAAMTSMGVLIAAPLRDVPLWMDWLAKGDPVTYGVDALRGVALSNTLPDVVLDQLVLHPILTNLAILAGFGLAFIIPAVWLFGKKD